MGGEYRLGDGDRRRGGGEGDLRLGGEGDLRRRGGEGERRLRPPGEGERLFLGEGSLCRLRGEGVRLRLLLTSPFLAPGPGLGLLGPSSSEEEEPVSEDD